MPEPPEGLPRGQGRGSCSTQSMRAGTTLTSVYGSHNPLREREKALGEGTHEEISALPPQC